jgi:Dolichyl-phosphate-mannose-protein mannosyltransferase
MSVEVAPNPSNASDVDDLRPGGGSLDPVHEEARNRIPDALLVVATGILLVALAYARSRGSLGFAGPLFWTGQILTFVFVAVRVLNPSTLPREREFLVILYAGAQSVIRFAYSPDMFTWYDEIQHLGSLRNVLATHHLFHPNLGLPISPRYPGLENVTAELAQVSSTSPFVAGVIVAGLAHLMLAASILLLFREVTRSSRVACIAVLLYMLSPQIHYFDTSFVYETVALPFLVLSLYFSIRFATRERGRYQSFAGLSACVLIVVITHHLTALATVAILATITFATWLSPRSRNLAKPLAICTASAALIVACWMFFVAPDTGDYLNEASTSVVNGVARLGRVEGKTALPTDLKVPILDRVCNPGGVALTLVLLAVGVRLARFRSPLERLFLLLAPAAYIAMISIRLGVGAAADGGKPDGAELAVRLLTYASLFTAVAVAVVLDRLVATAAARYHGLVLTPSGLMSATAIAIALLLHSTTTGLPQWWQRLPGVFRIDGRSSGVDAVGVSRAEWAATNLQPGSRYFGDITSVYVLGPLAQLDPINSPGSLYDTDRLIPEDSALIDGQQATYLDVDMRMAQEAPIVRSYFPADVMNGERETPIYDADLAKFDDYPGISRIYDSGYDHFYDLRGIKGIYG